MVLGVGCFLLEDSWAVSICLITLQRHSLRKLILPHHYCLLIFVLSIFVSLYLSIYLLFIHIYIYMYLFVFFFPWLCCLGAYKTA